tara:strand:+ start:41 stop:949 length:909 start_codon:yes stop_codon:yes gene_type:complete
MAKQGERYDPKTKTGWKFENGTSNYYVKGKKLSQLEIVKRGLAQGGENVLDTTKKLFTPVVNTTQNIKARMTRDPRSPVGDNVLTHNKKLLALQAQLDKDPKVIANQQALAASQSPAEFFGTNQYGDQSAQFNDPSSPLYKDGGTELAKVSNSGQLLSLNASPELMEGVDNINRLIIGNNVSQASARESILGDALTTDQIENNIEQGSGGGEIGTGDGNKKEGDEKIDSSIKKEPETKQRYNPNAGHENYDVASTAKGTAALSIQKKLLDAGFKQSDLNALAKNKRQSPIKALSKLFVKKGK